MQRPQARRYRIDQIALGVGFANDELVTAAPSADMPPAFGGDLAVLVIHDHPTTQPAWNKLFFSIVP